MAMPIQEENVSMMDILNLIPVYPETTRLSQNKKMALASELGICEDDKGRISWISEEAKKNAIEKTKDDKKIYSVLDFQKIVCYHIPKRDDRESRTE